MTNATTDDVTMDTLDVLIIESIETMKCSKKKRPDEHIIHDILFKKRNITEAKLPILMTD